MTFIGWLVLLTPLAIFGYAGLQLWPLYYNYMRVAHTLEQVATEFKAGADASPSSMRNSIEKHFEIDMVESPTPKDIKITKQGRGWILEAQYEGSAPLFANLSMKVDFDKVVRVGAAGDD